MLILNGCKTAVTSLLRRKLPSASSVASYSCVSSKRCPSLATISFRKAQLPHHQSVSVFNFRSNFYTTTGCNTSSPMPPVDANGDASAEVSQLIKDNKVMMFSKSTCPFCLKLKNRKAHVKRATGEKRTSWVSYFQRMLRMKIKGEGVAAFIKGQKLTEMTMLNEK